MWKISKLGEICNFEGGSQPPKSAFVYEQKDNYVRFNQIRDFKSDKNKTYIPVSKKNKLCCEDDILIGRYGASVGKILTGLSGAYNVAIMRAIPNKDILNRRYLYLYLSSELFQKPLQEVSQRSAQNGFSKNDIFDFEVPLPTLAEQQRIVAKLDAAFSEIDKGIAISYRKQEEVDKLKQSILESTFVYGVDNKKLGDVCDIIGGGTPSKSKASYYYGDIPWATVRDMSFDEISSTQHKITKLGLKKSSSNLIPKNNIIIASRVGLGKVCILKQDTAINQDLRGIIPKKEGTIKRKYLFYWFKSISNKIITAGRGATVQGVRLPFLKSLFLPLPSLAEQKRIVEKLDSVFKENEVVIKATKKQIINYKALKSIIIFNQLQKEAT